MPSGVILMFPWKGESAASTWDSLKNNTVSRIKQRRISEVVFFTSILFDAFVFCIAVSNEFGVFRGKSVFGNVS